MTDEPDQYVIAKLPPPGTARETLLRDAIAFGGSDELLRKFFGCEEAEQRLAAERQQTAEVAQRVAGIGMHLMDQVEALTAQQVRQDRREAKRKADQAHQEQEEVVRQEQEQILEYLETHPEPGAATDETHHPTGDLHSVDPVDKEKYDPEAKAEDNVGDLPAGIEDEPPPSLRDLEALGRPKDPKQVPQPDAVSLW